MRAASSASSAAACSGERLSTAIGGAGRQHARDLLAPCGGVEPGHRDGRAVGALLFGDMPVIGGFGGDLRRMRDDEDLEALAEALEALSHRCGDGPADPAVDLVEDQ